MTAVPRRPVASFGALTGAGQDAGEMLAPLVLDAHGQGIGKIFLEQLRRFLGPVQGVRGIAGATEFGDQEPVLVLDVSAFVDDTVVGKDAA